MDDNRLVRSIYEHSPSWVQNLFATASGLLKYRMRYRGAYPYWHEFHKSSLAWSKEEAETYRIEQVRALVDHALAKVPYYRNRYGALGIRKGDIRSLEDLKRLPLLEKSDLRQAGESILAEDFPRREVVSASTSGSSGYPLLNYWSREAEQREYGFSWSRRRADIPRGSSYGSFTGVRVVPSWAKQGPYWRVNHAANQTCYSVFHLSSATIPDYLEHLSRAGHAYLEGYPSPIYQLASYARERNISLDLPLKAIFTTSEILLPEYRQTIEEVFKTRIFDQYGQNEKVASITECEDGHLHYDHDYSHIEFNPIERQPEGGVLCEMICTGFHNLAAPLIRYRVGDQVVLPAHEVSCRYHSGQIIEAIHGRTAQALVGADGRRYTNISVVAKRCRNIEMMQCIQDKAGEITINVVRSTAYGPEDEKLLLQMFSNFFNGITASIRYVEDIERTSTGKFLSIINRIPSTPAP